LDNGNAYGLALLKFSQGQRRLEARLVVVRPDNDLAVKQRGKSGFGNGIGPAAPGEGGNDD
jgi:hypothetical protein